VIQSLLGGSQDLSFLRMLGAAFSVGAMRLALHAILATTTFAACGESGNSPPDAPLTIDAPATTDALPAFDCATSPTSGEHKVFLAFEGATLSDAAVSSSSENTAAFLADGVTATIPAWRADDPDREAHLQTVVCTLRETLYPYDIEVVTARPASGDYEMVVIGGRGTDLEINLSSGSVLNAMATTPCARGTNAREVSWVAEFPTTGAYQLTPIETATMAAYTLGINSLLSFSESKSNCMCHPLFASPCDTSRTCEFSESSMIPSEAHLCDRPYIVENQVEKLRARYGARR
jgi:hypothetical protein